jgi:hypothetical protein
VLFCDVHLYNTLPLKISHQNSISSDESNALQKTDPDYPVIQELIKLGWFADADDSPAGFECGTDVRCETTLCSHTGSDELARSCEPASPTPQDGDAREALKSSKRHVRHLNIFGTHLADSSIPSSLGRLSRLESLVVVATLLTGTIPMHLGSLPLLHTLDLNDNQLLQGTYPCAASVSSTNVSKFHGPF